MQKNINMDMNQMNSNMLFNGKTVVGQGEPFAVLNPATEETIAKINSATVDQVDQAVHAARTAFKTWQHVSDETINESFLKIAQDIRAESEEIAKLITIEQGKPLALSQFEVEAGANWIQYITSLEVPVETITDPSGKTIKVYNRP